MTAAPPPCNDVAVVILTFNEELNLAQALDSVHGWAREVHVLDSYSTDRTLDIARRYPCIVTQHKFENYAVQRNFAIERLPISCDWVLFLDADEWLTPEIKSEISRTLAADPQENGFYLNRRLIWRGEWVRRGYYPSWILRLFRRKRGRCEDRAINEHLIVEGEVGHLKHDFIHEDRKGVADWIEKHRRYAAREARELMNARNSPGYREIEASLFGSQAERKRWIRHKLWNRLPPLVRPFMYFFYRTVLAGGILDGVEALHYHYLHALWYPMQIDLKYLELRRSS